MVIYDRMLSSGYSQVLYICVGVSGLKKEKF